VVWLPNSVLAQTSVQDLLRPRGEKVRLRGR